MFYRIRVDLAFPAALPPGQIKSLAKTLLPNAITINPGALNQERGFITYECCYHDGLPASHPCELLEHYETTL